MRVRWTLLSKLPGGHRLDWLPRAHLPGASVEKVILTPRAWLDLPSTHIDAYPPSTAAPGRLAVPLYQR